ncbi:GNAT family N-acetyltransferase [Halobacillus fulvus]|nr:GNAT family N-acetyltransferase [Halobacillus fulvus]
MEIIEIRDQPDLLEQAVHAFWKQWGSEENYVIYENCIEHSVETDSALPSFYIMKENEAIIGTFALLRNDLNRRQDLCPWLACLYVAEPFRGKSLGRRLLDHGIQEAARKGYSTVYLTTDLDGYYEQYGWKEEGIAYNSGGESLKLYRKQTETDGTNNNIIET